MRQLRKRKPTKKKSQSKEVEENTDSEPEPKSTISDQSSPENASAVEIVSLENSVATMDPKQPLGTQHLSTHNETPKIPSGPFHLSFESWKVFVDMLKPSDVVVKLLLEKHLEIEMDSTNTPSHDSSSHIQRKLLQTKKTTFKSYQFWITLQELLEKDDVALTEKFVEFLTKMELFRRATTLEDTRIKRCMVSILHAVCFLKIRNFARSRLCHLFQYVYFHIHTIMSISKRKGPLEEKNLTSFNPDEWLDWIEGSDNDEQTRGGATNGRMKHIGLANLFFNIVHGGINSTESVLWYCTDSEDLVMKRMKYLWERFENIQLENITIGFDIREFPEFVDSLPDILDWRTKLIRQKFSRLTLVKRKEPPNSEE